MCRRAGPRGSIQSPRSNRNKLSSWLVHRAEQSVQHKEISMTDGEGVAAPALPPHIQLIQMCAGGWVAAAVYAAAKLGIADHLANGARSAAELASLTNTHPASLRRFMRTLAGFGILTEGDGDRKSVV